MLDNYFEYKHKTDFKTDATAGVSTFLTMAYIMFLNPVILSMADLILWCLYCYSLCDGTCLFHLRFLCKNLACWTSACMGINAFIAYGVCLGMQYTPEEALGAVLAGIVFLIISLTPIRAWLINSIPKFKTWY